MTTAINKYDTAMARFMLAVEQIDDDDVAITAMFACAATMLHQKHNTRINNILIFPYLSSYGFNIDNDCKIGTEFNNVMEESDKINCKSEK